MSARIISHVAAFLTIVCAAILVITSEGIEKAVWFCAMLLALISATLLRIEDRHPANDGEG